MSGSVCSCELSLGDGHCRSTTPTLTTTALSSTPALTASALSSTPALTTRAPPFRLAGNECIDPQVRAETNDAGGVSRWRTRQTELQTRKRTRYRKPRRHSVWPKTNALSRKCGQRPSWQAVPRKGGHAKRNPRLASERAIEKGTLPSPHTLARRRFRLAGKCPAVPIMRCHRQGQAFPVWRGGQTEWRCGVR